MLEVQVIMTELFMKVIQECSQTIEKMKACYYVLSLEPGKMYFKFKDFKAMVDHHLHV